MSGTCENCKHWGAGERPITACNVDEKKHCARLYYGLNSERSPAFLENGDYASGEACLWTDPGFSCSMHEGTP